ncbi:tRNA-specific adenosine deaminase subunit tad2 [Ceratocystis lukuohia]|uniref:tRNA-specific adenosine deaminase subunit tad2 n=1 Tax=Ceratocystis lukuohia TaxID=2019550 RepID=A0ABR4M8V4_9PEZI
MTMNGGVSLNDRGLSNVTNVAAMSRLPDDIEALKLKENTQPNDLSAASDINNDGPDDSSPVCPDDTSEALSTRLSFAGSTHSFAPLRPLVPLGEAGRPTRTPEEDAVHEAFTQAALEMARLALRTNETPVGCVLVHKGKVIAKGMNATNVTRNGTRHAEFMAVCSLLGQPAEAGGDVSFVSAAKAARAFHEANQARKAAEAAAIAAAMLAADVNSDARSVISATTSISSLTPSTSSSTSQAAARVKVEHEGVSEDVVSKSYLYPYGQKWWPEDNFNPDIFHECTLYVTVEPCVMCASFLRQLGIQKVFFGAVNDKFGGTGGVFNIHKNCQKLDETQLAQGTDGGPVGRGYDVEGGWGRNEAVALLRRFYVQENGRAPVPRKKEGRAARLAALEQVNGITVGEVDAGMISSLDDTTVGTPMTISSI